MTATFYGVLGVGPDADADAIRRGYRERAAEVHPDVNDAPDATSEFRRLTTAKETLLDETERSRYDRLGHASYVRHHVTCSAWEIDVTEASEGNVSDPDGHPDDADANETSAAASRTVSGRSSGTDRTANAREYDGGTRGGRSERWGATDGVSTSARETSTAERTGPADGPAGGTTGPGDGSVSDRDAGARATADIGTGATGDTGKARSVSDAYTTSSFWDSQRVGERYAAGETAEDPLFVRLVRGVRALGSWTIVHLVFLTLAVATSWFVYSVVLSGTVTSPVLLLVLFGEVALAVILSTVHVLTRVYS